MLRIKYIIKHTFFQEKSQKKSSIHHYGRVRFSSSVNIFRASSRQEPHISSSGCREPQTSGRSGLPKIRQRIFSSRLTQGTPAGLPSGIPGIGDVIEGAIQQAPHFSRQMIFFMVVYHTPEVPQIQVEFSGKV